MPDFFRVFIKKTVNGKPEALYAYGQKEAVRMKEYGHIYSDTEHKNGITQQERI